MKRVLFAFALCAAILLAACGETFADSASIISACEKHAAKQTYSAKFRLNMTFENGQHTLVFSQGSYTADLSGGTPYVKVSASQNYLSNPSAVEGVYENGVYRVYDPYAGEEAGVSEYELSKTEFFGQILFMQPSVPDDKYIKSSKAVKTAVGEGVCYELKDATELLLPLLGESIYDLALIKKPKRELTEALSASLTLVPSETGVYSMTLNFSLRLADTPPYVPGGGDLQEDYTLYVDAEYTVTYE